jgi:hypothetical protein
MLGCPATCAAAAPDIPVKLIRGKTDPHLNQAPLRHRLQIDAPEQAKGEPCYVATGYATLTAAR